MTQKIGKGLVPPAKFTNIIKDLYENTKIKGNDGIKVKYFFSQVKLTAEQKALLTYPSVYYPLDIYIVYQVDTFRDSVLVSTEIVLVSFIKKVDAFIYGYYFNVSNQPRYEIDCLIKSKKAVVFMSGCEFKPMNHLEVHNDVNGITTILGLNSDNILSSIQFAHGTHYYYQDLISTGVDNTTIPKIKMIGLSKNLRRLAKKLN